MTRFLATNFCRFYWASTRLLNWHPPGLGFALRSIGKDFQFTAHGRRFWFDHRSAGAYCLLIAGISNEPETIRFLHSVFSRFPTGKGCRFVDVGASIGEMVIYAAGFPCVSSVTAFEPQASAAESIRRSAALNGFTHVQVFTSAVSDTNGRLSFVCTAKSPTASHIAAPESASSHEVPSTTLDTAFNHSQEPAVLLIDVEGAELRVVRGGRQFIERNRRLIIFEYNDVTRRHFRLEEMAAELGPGYEIYRLRCNGDGRLDKDLTSTYNLVAVPKQSIFEPICATVTI